MAGKGFRPKATSVSTSPAPPVPPLQEQGRTGILTAKESGEITRGSKASPPSTVLSQDCGSEVQPSKRLT